MPGISAKTNSATPPAASAGMETHAAEASARLASRLRHCEHSALLEASSRRLAHDLSNPLNAMCMNAELANRYLERGEPGRAADALQRVSAECQRLGDSIHMAASASRQHALPEDCELSALFGAVQALVLNEYALPASAIRLRQPAEMPARLHIRALPLQLALHILLRNVFETGGSRAELALQQQAGKLDVRLHHDGHLPACEPRPAQLRELSLAQELIRGVGGALTWYEPGEIYFNLPLKPEPALELLG